jgi:hypothetical protein
MPDLDPIAPWLRKTVTDFDRQNAPKVEEVKQEAPKVIDPAAPKVEVPAPLVKEELPVVPVPPVVEEPLPDAAAVSTVPPATASPAPVVTPAPVTTPVSAQPPTSPLK